MTVKEIEAFYEVYDVCEKKMKAANRLQLPYSLAEWLIKQRERSVREDEEYEQWLEEEEEISYIMALTGRRLSYPACSRLDSTSKLLCSRRKSCYRLTSFTKRCQTAGHCRGRSC